MDPMGMDFVVVCWFIVDLRLFLHFFRNIVGPKNDLQEIASRKILLELYLGGVLQKPDAHRLMYHLLSLHFLDEGGDTENQSIPWKSKSIFFLMNDSSIKTIKNYN